MRTHYCGTLNEHSLEHDVVLCGWVHRRRDHGGVIFIDLRDRTGLIQIVFHPEEQACFKAADRVRNEYVLKVKGKVRHRPEGTVNTAMPTGKVEVYATEIEVLNPSEPLPFALDEYAHVNEDVRLRYRYLDLRRLDMQQRFQFRAKVLSIIRNYFDENGFLDIETPILTRATPEGARDYLVPSRTQPGAFFALPQSPQLFKQLLMVAGMDRYYQIARCFRDEDLRADRQPEFTQLDVEASFIDEAYLQELIEGLMRRIFEVMLGTELPEKFPRMTYHEAMMRYGSDKPDLRIPLELIDISDIVKDVDFKVFSEPAHHPEGRVAALCIPQGSQLSRKEIDEYTDFVKQFGARGLAYIKVNEIEKGIEGLQSPILKFLTPKAIHEIIHITHAKNGDLIFFGADKAKIVNNALGALRVKMGHDLKIVEPGWRFLWVVDFPMFEYNDDEKRWDPLHHPFTAPSINDVKDILERPGECLSRAYDIVLNGTELGGGSIRIHDEAMQKAVFHLLNIDEEHARHKFGFLLDGLKFGCPPLGGIALGLDRMIMLLTGAQSIREVIAFPKTATASCLMTGAPSIVDESQLKELKIKIKSEGK